MRIIDRPTDKAGRERVILAFLVQGKTQPEIGRELGISRASVARVLTDLARRHGVTGTVALIAEMAFRGTLPGAPSAPGEPATESEIREAVAAEILDWRPKVPMKAWDDPESLWETDKHMHDVITRIALSVCGRTGAVAEQAGKR